METHLKSLLKGEFAILGLQAGDEEHLMDLLRFVTLHTKHSKVERGKVRLLVVAAVASLTRHC